MNQRLRKLREAGDLTQREIAACLHCTQVCYSHYENGKRDVPTTAVERLADFYAVSVDYLLGRTNEMTPYPKK